VQRDSLVETADDSESRGFDRSRTGHHPRQQLASRVRTIIQPTVLPCQGRACSFRGFYDGFVATMAIDLFFEDFLQEIRECGPKDEHAMGSGHDGVGMLDIQLT
jgi:hypothetical protein